MLLGSLLGSKPSSPDECIVANLLFAQLETSFVWAALGTHFSLAVETVGEEVKGEGGVAQMYDYS